MKTREEIQTEMESKQDGIAKLQERHAANAAEIARIHEQNAAWHAENPDRERLAASVTTRQDNAVRLEQENKEFMAAIDILKLDLIALERQEKAVAAVQELKNFTEHLAVWQGAKAADLVECDELVAGLKAFTEHHTKFATMRHPGDLLHSLLQSIGRELSIPALLRDEVKLAPQENEQWLDQQIDAMCDPVRNGRMVDLSEMQRVFNHVGDDVAQKIALRRSLRERLPIHASGTERRTGGMKQTVTKTRPFAGPDNRHHSGQQPPEGGYHPPRQMWPQGSVERAIAEQPIPQK
jgi:hypothetical protein